MATMYIEWIELGDLGRIEGTLAMNADKEAAANESLNLLARMLDPNYPRTLAKLVKEEEA